MFLNDLFESTSNVLVVLPGRFHPFHKGHHAIYNSLLKEYGRDRVFIVTSNKVELPKSPFSFSDKIQFMTLAGVPADRIVECAQPYKANELTQNFNASSTKLVFAISEKDVATDPRFKSWFKKDGTPTYFQLMPNDPAQMSTFNQHRYIKIVPTVKFTVAGQPIHSATEIRAQFAQADENTQKVIVKDLFGNYNDDVLRIMQQKLV